MNKIRIKNLEQKLQEVINKIKILQKERNRLYQAKYHRSYRQKNKKV